MCIAVPMKVVDIKGNTAVVEYSEVKREVGLHLLDDVHIDDWVIIHTGFAISKLNEAQAQETLSLLKEGGFISL
jgi:hydrogenase expression/formation protein HypC